MSYKHGIEVAEKATSLKTPLSTEYAAQVIFGTAPVNLAEYPEKAVNTPIMANSFEEAKAALGYSEDWKNYTLCQSMDASYNLFQVSPVIFVNVLDPERHVKELEEMTVPVSNGQAIVASIGILLKDLTVKMATETRTGSAEVGAAAAAGNPVELTVDEDYLASFNDSGYLVVTILSSGAGSEAQELIISGKVLAPDLVTEEDLIGAYDSVTGKETGLEVLRQVYPRFGIAPGFLLAPGWSEKPNIGAALQGKCQDINGVFRCMCLLDLDTAQAQKYSDCEKVKEESGYSDPHAVVLWPRLTRDGKEYAYSAVYGAMACSNTIANNDVPYQYPSNKALNADGAVLENGEEICLDQVQAGVVNGAGVVTALHDSSWKAYGNNTACYPENTDPKDRWIGCRRMFDYVGNHFAIAYREKLDSNMNRRTIDDIVNSFNIWGNSLVAAGMCAGLYAEYRSDENTTEDVLAGHLKLRVFFAPYTPAEYISTVMEFDVETLENAFKEE